MHPPIEHGIPWRTVVWKDLCRTGLDCIAIDQHADGFRAEGRLVGLEGECPLSADYRIDLDTRWRTRSLRADWGLGSERSSLHLVRDESGAWSDDQGPRSDLAGCEDVDLMWTPFTNSLPIRRLGLAIGASAHIQVAWVKPPALDVIPAGQRYTRLSERVYRYESLATAFTADVEVDEDGLVIDYPKLFRRLAVRRG